MLEIAQKIGSKKFVNISTDKAASPISVLGRSKFLAELLTAYYKMKYRNNFVSVRFGNVFGSRGSVIETFIDQIERGMPITLTHEKVSRYFMHPDEAAFLTLKSIFVDHGDVHLFDMGSAVLIHDIINQLQDLLHGKSNIVYTGLRDGEKLHEDLFAGIENRIESIPGFIESSDHSESLRLNSDLVTRSLSQSDLELLNFLTLKD
jgi:FlaA1/EpsC-like NDP-sugar epimerase